MERRARDRMRERSERCMVSFLEGDMWKLILSDSRESGKVELCVERPCRHLWRKIRQSYICSKSYYENPGTWLIVASDL